MIWKYSLEDCGDERMLGVGVETLGYRVLAHSLRNIELHVILSDFEYIQIWWEGRGEASIRS